MMRRMLAGIVQFNLGDKKMSIQKKIKAVLGFHGVSDADLLKRLNTVHDGLVGNAAYPTPPVDLAAFKTAIDSFTVLLADAADGGRRAISAKNKQRVVLIKLVTQLGHYVEAAADDDLATFNTSGFTPFVKTSSAPAALPPARIKWVDRGPNSGQIVVKPQPLPGALHFDLQYGVVSKGSVPTTWETIPLTSTKPATITDLTPGATYTFQIRALGRLGYTDWSDSVTFICA
jgi:hypothetical protein